MSGIMPEGMVCPICSTRFDRSNKRQKYCSEECALEGKRRRYKHDIDGGSRFWYSATITAKSGGWVKTLVGYGGGKRQAREDAEKLLGSYFKGEPFEILCVSTPNSIFRDLQRSA